MNSTEDVTREPLLRVNSLNVAFHAGHGYVEAVHDISFDLEQGETLAVLGESGSGKTVTALAIMGLLGPHARTSGSVSIDRAELLDLPESARRRFRGKHAAMIFQDALDALNPVQTVGWQISEAVRAHQRVSRNQTRAQAVELMHRVGIPDAARRVGSYPHQFSGGMRQRIMIAMALALQPRLLIADEPTTALDVTVQAQIIDLLLDIQAESKTAILLITHDLAVALDLADRIAVMYAGRLVELGTAEQIFDQPAHPYTRALIASAPHLARKGGRLPAIPGAPPLLTRRPDGCAFHPRCPVRIPRCATELPILRRSGSDAHLTACHLTDAAC